MMNPARDQDRRIVVGVDSSHGSKVALRWALAQARLTSASVEAVTAWQHPMMYGNSYWAMPFPVDDGVAAMAEKALAETVADIVGTQDEPVDVRTTVAEGPAAYVLLTAAVDAQLLVVGSRGHGGFAGMLLGSVSQHCAHHAPCPVVVIPDDDTSKTTA
jgi:nucleotide-binding universal stress UspA family protein